jgi:cell division protein FtsL
VNSAHKSDVIERRIERLNAEWKNLKALADAKGRELAATIEEQAREQMARAMHKRGGTEQ